jgi:hypothetical protein
MIANGLHCDVITGLPKIMLYFMACLALVMLFSCTETPPPEKEIFTDARPWTRWWWFSGSIPERDIRYQLDWLKANHFGGVEIAWVYPLEGTPSGPRWLSDEWSRRVAYTKQYADSIRLGCDFTCGTLWPFGGSFVPAADAARTFHGLSDQRLRKSWEEPHADPGYILNHLDRGALERYMRRMGAGLSVALEGSTSSLFCDSWEVRPEELWSPGLDDRFRQEFGYELEPFKSGLDAHPAVRYDYRKFIAGVILDEFHEPYTRLCHELGARSRVQCHGAPTDLLAAYAAVDIPESEAILFDPPFARLAASAAALTGKTLVSAEAFTCLYGWRRWPGPGQHQGEERLVDLKLLADALFANGVNFIIWHGMPFNPEGGGNRFYASVHVGPDSAFAAQLPSFNRYMEQISTVLRRGKPYTDIAVNLPLEDNWMRHELPPEQRRPSAQYHWELQYERFPEELRGYHPHWVSYNFLADAEFHDGRLHIGAVDFAALYVDVEWLDAGALEQLTRLARQGLPVCLRRRPAQPGHLKSKGYDRMLDELTELENVRPSPQDILPAPLISGNCPEFTCREEQGELWIFLAHPHTRTLSFPMGYGQADSAGQVDCPLKIRAFGRQYSIDVRFEPGQSIILRVPRDGPMERMYLGADNEWNPLPPDGAPTSSPR